VSFYDDRRGMVVGGAAFQNGTIARVGEFQVLLGIDSFENELATVTYSDSNTVHAMGYGLILRSTNGGGDWLPSSLTGDFFLDVQFVNTLTGYAIGLAGTIIKTDDGGERWRKLRDGDDWGQQRYSFRSLYFVDGQRGYIVGDDGLMLRTLNGGDNWQRIDLPTKLDLSGVFAIGGLVYAVGEGGIILRLTDS
ncbi:MAG: YCF48-related protein, partial [Bacteroidota bacterium]